LPRGKQGSTRKKAGRPKGGFREAKVLKISTKSGAKLTAKALLTPMCTASKFTYAKKRAQTSLHQMEAV